MLIRGSLAIGLILVSVLLLALLFGETNSADSHGDGGPPASSSGLPLNPNGKAPVAQPGVPPVVEWVVEVDVTPELLGRLMQDELQANRGYIASIRSQKGEKAALEAEEAVKAPYLQRVAAIEAGAKATESIPMVTIYGIWSFSKTSHRGAYLSPSDPVSILYYWDGKADGIYSRMDSIHTCRPDEGTCNHFPQYQDHDARAIPFISCSSSAQWVYMGNAGKGNGGRKLSWHASEYGLMKEDDACYGEARDHMRIYGSVRHPKYKWWSVATPHHEQWGFTGHTVDSWISAQELFAGSWVESGLSNDKPGWDTSVFWWSFSQWGNDGTYGGRDVYFDGMGIVIGTDR